MLPCSAVISQLTVIPPVAAFVGVGTGSGTVPGIPSDRVGNPHPDQRQCDCNVPWSRTRLRVVHCGSSAMSRSSPTGGGELEG